MAILVEVFAQAPFYAVALFAWIRRRSWIRTPAIMYSVVLLTILPIVLAEQYYGDLLVRGRCRPSVSARRLAAGKDRGASCS